MKEDINLISRFLAKRDLMELTKGQLRKQFGIEQADVMFVFGNELPYVIEFASQKFLDGLARKMVICGGIGHGTELLRHSAVSSDYFCDYEQVKDLSEAEIYGKIARERFKIPKEHIFLDTTSTNCGENAVNGLKILEENQLEHQTIILIQDPTLQLRSKLSLEQHCDESVILSYAPFIPKVMENEKYAVEISHLWKFSRFMELLLGEIPRLNDNQYGYGPKGKKFIPHIEIPLEVLEAYERMKKEYRNFNTRKLNELLPVERGEKE